MALTRLGLNQAINLSTNTTGNLNLASQVTGTLPTANGGTGATSFAPGKVLQCISYTHGAATATSSTSFVNFSSMLVTITPSATDSKILVMHSAPSTAYVDNNTNMGHVAIFRDSTNITTLGHNSTYASYQSTDYNNGSSIIFLDSPSSTSALEYRVKLKVDNASLQFVYGSHYSNGSQPRQSSLTCMEIAA